MAHSPATVPAIVAVPASGPGAIAGFRVTCPSCGFTFTSSLLGIAEADAAEHVAYMLRKEQASPLCQRTDCTLGSSHDGPCIQWPSPVLA